MQSKSFFLRLLQKHRPQCHPGKFIDGTNWWARINGVRYPQSGTYAMALAGQALTAYPRKNGHKDLSKSGDRTLTPGNTLEEGIRLTTANPYVIASGPR